MKRKVIYDLGANNGDDVPYYLMKSDVIVAVEANPVLCKAISDKFRAEIQAGKLVLENCVVTAGGESGTIDFYIHKSNHVLSQLLTPAPRDLDNFERVALPSKPIAEIVCSHGDPYYIKIDIEHYDAQILRALFRSNIFPPFISAESHSVEVFSAFVEQGGYKAFKLVDGISVSKIYSNRQIKCDKESSQVKYSFPFHSAGPFGNDVDGGWMTVDNFFKLLAFEGLGWKDIHATNQEEPDPLVKVQFGDYIWPYVKSRTMTSIRRIKVQLRSMLRV